MVAEVQHALRRCADRGENMGKKFTRSALTCEESEEAKISRGCTVVADVAQQLEKEVGGVIGVGDEDHTLAFTGGVLGDLLDGWESDAERQLDLLFSNDERLGEAAGDAIQVTEDLVDLQKVHLHASQNAQDHPACAVLGIDAQSRYRPGKVVRLEGGMLGQMEEDVDWVLDIAYERGVEDVEGDDVD